MPILIILIILIIVFGPSLWASRVLKHYNQNEYFSGNGIDLAQLALSRSGMHEVKLEITESGDHYDPESKSIRLSRARCGKRTLTAVVVAAHEVGHAIQDRINYTPLRTRTRMIRTAARLEKIGATAILLVPVLAAITRVPAAGGIMLLGGFATLCVPVFVHFLTLPCEFDASFNRALPMLISGKLIPSEDIPAARRILTACALTYVANALVGLLNVWRWIRILRR